MTTGECFGFCAWMEDSACCVLNCVVACGCSGFAAPTDGYGVTYNLYNEGIGFTIIEKVSDKTTSATRFSEVLQQAIRDLRSTLDEGNPRSKL